MERSWLSGVLIPVCVAITGIVAQALWFSSQFGNQQARIEELERRISTIENGGSSALQAVRADVRDATGEVSRLRDWRVQQMQVNLEHARDIAVLQSRINR